MKAGHLYKIVMIHVHYLCYIIISPGPRTLYKARPAAILGIYIRSFLELHSHIVVLSIISFVGDASGAFRMYLQGQRCMYSCMLFVICRCLNV